MSEFAPRVAVLVKQVPDVNEVTIDPPTRKARMGTARILNTYDRYALAAALEIRDRAGGSVTAITAGPPEAREILLRCLASGADEAVLVDLPQHNELDTLAIAKALTRVLQDREIDLVVAGQSTEDYEAGQVGPQVAELVGWPHVTLVTRVELEGRRLRIRRDAERTKEDVSVDLPAVLMVLSGRDSEQRHPTLRGMMAARKKHIEVVTPVIEDHARLAWTEPRAEVREATGIMVQGEPPAEAARQLVAWLREQRLA